MIRADLWPARKPAVGSGARRLETGEIREWKGDKPSVHSLMHSGAFGVAPEGSISKSEN
jgi:hypothetical protein